ncbi:MAG: DUF1080 domain-containing protein, partial [Armatimonadetes bacterium]|nr:DUF1080 domain-containing protein [Armatimonadota bacterium]
MRYLALLLLALPTLADQATLTIDAAHPGPPVSPTLYGLFFEEINHAGDGGLYAEMIRNRAFEDADTPAGWQLLTRGGAAADMRVDDTMPANPRTPHALRVEVRGPGSAGAANGGYWGLDLRRGKRCHLALDARAEGLTALTVRLETPAGQTLAQTALTGLTAAWRRFTADLTAQQTNANARLVIASESPGTFWLDNVSLFPAETFKGRPNGLRADLAGMLAELRPAFIRFPGGCFVEGNRLANATRWKTTIGPCAARPGHWNLWGYRSTDGLGYHEYLQMCEDLGAEPLFVINCGMAHEDHVPDDQLGGWIQDALDAVEYANGAVTTKWGAERAKNGHPAPFGLEYLEIGNENGGPVYESHYALFHDALKQAYPDLKLIANTPVRTRPIDILDEHYYSSPDWFASQAHHYDKYDRNGPRIYVGEYAVTQNCGQGNLRAALGEAAFMCGLERNSDIVTMASYAPLFVHVANRAWNPDAIVFDNAHCFGTPSYHVQKLFSRHRADVVLPAEVRSETFTPELGGAIGLSTWQTQAEFKDIRVTRGDQVLYSSDFTQEAAGWKPLRGQWSVVDGAYREGQSGEDMRSTFGDPAWTNYTYSLRARKLAGAEGFLIMFKVRGEGDWLWWNIGGWGNQRHAIEKCAAGQKSILTPAVDGAVETGRWHDIRIELDGPKVRCWLDGKLIHDTVDSGPEPLAVVAGRRATGEIVVKVVNTSGVSQDTEIRLEGVAKLASEARSWVLTGVSPDDENSFGEPGRVAAVEVGMKGV